MDEDRLTFFSVRENRSVPYALGLIVTLVGLVGSTPSFAESPLTPVEVAPVVSRNVQEKISFVATIEPNIATTVGAMVDGKVVQATVREGDRVVLGKTVLVQLDRTSREIALNESQAAVDKARQRWEELRRGYRSEEIAQRRAEAEEQKALLTRAEQDFRRAERLYRRELISLAEFEQHQSNYLAAKEKHRRVLAALRMAEEGPRKEEIAQARAELREAEAHHSQIAYELHRTTLRSPLTGFLIKKYVDVGTWVHAGDAIADLIDLDPVFASGPVGERYISLLRIGLSATVRVDAIPGKGFGGTVSHIVPQADPQSRTFPVKVSIPNPHGRLKSGMLARVSVKVGEKRQGYFVPKDAVVRREADEVIFVVVDGLAREYKVTTGRVVKGLMEVYHHALKTGQAVVVLGNGTLKDGAKIRVVDHYRRGPGPRSQ
ncbi:MAG: efflux RND transporter periplasmic adaptor subunit [Candidatus Binatia bacterium]